MELLELLKNAVGQNGSDVFIIPGAPVTVKVDGRSVSVSEDRVTPERAGELVRSIYETAHRNISFLTDRGDDDFSFAIRDLSRFRCNAYMQRGSMAAVIRIVAFQLPRQEDLHIPEAVINLVHFQRGMILVTGPAGSGKSTTMACMIDRINSTRSGHIVTIEDPIEHLHRHKMSLVTQREVPNDVPTFSAALRAALRQAPDVIMLGEMRDLDTIRTAITAAETGHLLLSSLHTRGTAETVDRLVDSFPAEQQAQIRAQLAQVLRAVVSQTLIPTTDGGRIPLFEVMTVNAAIQNMIRDGRTHQIDNAINSAGGQLTIDSELMRLTRAGRITRETALQYAANRELLERRI